MTQLYPYLAFNNTKEALKYYEEVFGATDIQRLAVDPSQAENFGVSEEEADNKTMHSEFTIASVTLYASDAFGKDVQINEGISLLIDYDINDEADAKRVEALYDKVKDDESVHVDMPLAEQFWGGKMGSFTDKYNVRWMLHGQDHSKQ
ncbi:VOC family protein [Staphylococcus simulans]|uniref:VOC family protein n=1 Tax=Staphylococcus simulans TaxID=1286 RepID=UPI000709377E|nr:VOC family protein [Staphylococcus simulans]MDU0419377.1 VOC family protein [Staphylococcus simulans]MDU0466493.1 VOC family protein [Staphylococcus simulans]PTI94429.1 VOC family protein [Staphylococcus simulans]PTJ05885.1 VOC family protein [Staphylococcus simulans]PTJ11566.1 VOC family protein [Staphylococcus simulans]